MRRSDHTLLRNKVLAGAFLSFSLAAVPAQPLPARQSQPSLNKLRSMAEAQHEIVMILIRKKDFNKAVEEADKIFAMNWPSAEEPTLLKELLYLSDQFRRNSHPEIGVGFLDANMNIFKDLKSRIAILKEKGYLLKSMNEDDKALECFREAQRLEKSAPS